LATKKKPDGWELHYIKNKKESISSNTC